VGSPKKFVHLWLHMHVLIFFNLFKFK
jgi:hypothetical protein